MAPADSHSAGCLPVKPVSPGMLHKFIPPSDSPSVALCGGLPLWHLSLSHTGLMLVPMLQTAQTTTDKPFPVPSSRSFHIQIALPAGRQHKEGTFSQKPYSWGTLPTRDEQFDGLDPVWIVAGLAQDRIYRAGRAPEQAVLSTGM